MRTRPAETENDLRIWYRLYLETMRRNVVPARPYRLFLAMWELMRPKGLMRLLLAEQQTDTGARIIGGHLFFFFGATVTYAFGASSADDFALRPNDIIMGQGINDASEAGYRFVDLGEVPEGDENLGRFKSKWGAERVRMYRYYSPDFPDDEHGASEEANSSSPSSRTGSGLACRSQSPPGWATAFTPTCDCGHDRPGLPDEPPHMTRPQ